MMLIDPPSAEFSSDEAWIGFWLDIRTHTREPEARKWTKIAERELKKRGFDTRELGNA